jgi:hypothetical protein
MYKMSMLFLKPLVVFGFHELQVLREAKKSSVTHVARATVFWDPKGVILVDIMPRGQTINTDLYIQSLKTFQKCSGEFDLNVVESLLQLDSIRNEYQGYLLEGKGGRCVGLTTLPPSCADCLEIVGASNSWSLNGLSRPLMGQLYLYTGGSGVRLHKVFFSVSDIR